MVIDSTKGLHYFLEENKIELNICSDTNPAYKKIKRIDLDV